MPDRGRPLAVSAREAFADWVRASECRIFGQLMVRASGEEFEIRHHEDAGEEGLKLYTDPRAARELAATTASGEHRPLKSSPNLRRGWSLHLDGVAGLGIAMNYLYPAAIVHWHLWREGRLHTTSFRKNAARQSGIYTRIQHLSDGGVQLAAKACCEDAVCLKRTLWDVDDDTPLRSERGEGQIPCPEPCSMFVSFARQVRSFEREREQLPEGQPLTAGERGDLAALLETTASGELILAREGEFQKPLNLRRLRYRRLTLAPLLSSEP